MKNNLSQLEYVINIDKFQKIQDDIAKATEMAVLTVDYKGAPITKHSRCSEFCTCIRSHPQYAKLCQKCDARGGLEAVRTQKPYIYLCHFGLIDFAVPIIVNDQYLGAIMAGQVFIKYDENKKNLENIVNTHYDKIDLDFECELNQLRKKIPVMTLHKIQAISNMLFHMSNYLVNEAVLKISLNELNEKIRRISKEPSALKHDLHHHVIHHNQYNEDSKSQQQKMDDVNLLIKPALEYIHENYAQKLYLNDIAALCNISPSYCSKLFKRETGDSFSNYVNKVKVEKAKELLRTTNKPIINISYDLGFEDCGYFIKVFKKIVELTPAVYRKKQK